jgi:hypothetical protein
MEVIQLTRFSDPYRTIVVEPAPARAPDGPQRPDREKAEPEPAKPVRRPDPRPAKR